MVMYGALVAASTTFAVARKQMSPKTGGRGGWEGGDAPWSLGFTGAAAEEARQSDGTTRKDMVEVKGECGRQKGKKKDLPGAGVHSRQPRHGDRDGPLLLRSARGPVSQPQRALPRAAPHPGHRPNHKQPNLFTL